MYKKEQMWHLYRAIAHFASITYPIECADPRLECSLLVDPTTKSTLFVVLNHTKEKITTVVKVFDNLSNPQTISLSLSEFGVHYQFFSK